MDTDVYWSLLEWKYCNQFGMIVDSNFILCYEYSDIGQVCWKLCSRDMEFAVFKDIVEYNVWGAFGSSLPH